MHILLTDVLTCPRCGPGFGLIVLADVVLDRSVIRGSLGCANCRNEYRIADGVADLRLKSPAGASDEVIDGAPDADRGFRIAALSGLGERPGMMMLRGGAPRLVEEVAGLLPNAQVFGSAASPPVGGGGDGAGWIVHDGEVPLRDATLMSAALLETPTRPEVLDAMRVVAPGGRLIVENLPPECTGWLTPEGWTLLLYQEGVAVASRSVRG